MLRVLLAALLAVPLRAVALDAGEFHLYGVNKAGIAFDITPNGEDAAGDPESKQGYRGEYVGWVKGKEASVAKPSRVCTAMDSRGQCVRWEQMYAAGRCTVWLAPDYRVTCAAGMPLPLTGITYAGEKLEASRVSKIPDAHRLYKSFLRRYDGARPILAAVYRCKEGCNDAVPATLLFLWLGD